MKHTNEVMQIPNVDGYTRLANLVLGAFMIAAIFVVSVDKLGWLTLLPITAVYPMFVAITGYSPHRALLDIIVSRIRGLWAEDGQL